MEPDLNTSAREVTSEHSLLALMRLAFKIHTKTINVLLPLLLSAIVFCLSLYKPISGIEVMDVIKNSVGWIYSILSLLVAGYTIFATLTSLELSVALMGKIEKTTGLPYLKYVHATFYKTIFIFTLTGFIGSILVFAYPARALAVAFSIEAFGFNFLPNIVLATYLFLFSFSMMSLGSFLYNIYASVMMSVRWAMEGKKS